MRREDLKYKNAEFSSYHKYIKSKNVLSHSLVMLCQNLGVSSFSVWAKLWPPFSSVYILFIQQLLGKVRQLMVAPETNRSSGFL